MFCRKILLGVQQLCSTPCLVGMKTRLHGDEAIFLSKRRPSKLRGSQMGKSLEFSSSSSFFFCMGRFMCLKGGVGKKSHSCLALAVGAACAVFSY